MQFVRLPETCIVYDGTQLHWDFGYRRGIIGDSAILFRGPASVSPQHLVDLEDAITSDVIISPDMFHILITKFHEPLLTAIYRQRYWIRCLADVLEGFFDEVVSVDGDDLIVRGRKLSVSIATTSGHTTMIHIGLNNNAPKVGDVRVETIGFEDMMRKSSADLTPAENMLRGFCEIMCAQENEIVQASYKVRPSY